MTCQSTCRPEARNGNISSTAWLNCSCACTKEYGVQNSAARTLSVNMTQFKGSKFIRLIDLSAYPEAKCPRIALEGQSATLHVENWQSAADIARCFISLSHQMIVKVDQDGGPRFQLIRHSVV